MHNISTEELEGVAKVWERHENHLAAHYVRDAITKIESTRARAAGVNAGVSPPASPELWQTKAALPEGWETYWTCLEVKGVFETHLIEIGGKRRRAYGEGRSELIAWNKAVAHARKLSAATGVNAGVKPFDVAPVA